MNHSWQWFEDDFIFVEMKKSPHNVIVTGEQEKYVRLYIYSTIGKKGSFSLHFDDLRFSTPLQLVRGSGVFNFENTQIFYTVEKEQTILFGETTKALINFVCEAIDAGLKNYELNYSSL